MSTSCFANSTFSVCERQQFIRGCRHKYRGPYPIPRLLIIVVAIHMRRSIHYAWCVFYKHTMNTS